MAIEVSFGFAADVPEPGPAAEIAFDFDGGTPSAAVNELNGINVTYSDVVAGPIGESTVARCWIAANDNDFGGYIPGSFPMGLGEDLWIRSFHYFPSAFCAGYGSAGDGWGRIKWMRVEWFNESGFRRFTGQLGGFDGSTCNPNGPRHSGATTEGFLDGTHNLWWPTELTIPRDQWVALQWHIHSDDAANGYLRGWLNDTYLGQVSGNATHPGASFSNVRLVYGDYWNGDSPQENIWYVSDFIFTKSAPDVDSGGRPYIAPTTRVSQVIG